MAKANHHEITSAEISFESVSFSYGQQVALESVTFVVQRGEFLALLGHNGSGKTTLMKIALGLLKPKGGKVLFRGEDISRLPKNNRIGYVQQAFDWFDFQFPASVEEVVLLGRLIGKQKLFHKYNENDYFIAKNAMIAAGIYNLRDRKIGELSGGQVQKAFLAKALASEAELLFLDEPASAMDIESQRDFYKLLKKINQEKGITIFLISHDIGQVLEYATKVVVLDKRVVFEGHPAHFDAKSIWKLAERI